MDKKQKLILLVIGFCMFVVACVVAFNVLMPKPEITPDEVEVSDKVVEEVMPEEDTNKNKVYVNIYFIGKNSHSEEVYKAVKRTYDKSVDGSKIRFAIYSLVNGPKSEERAKGVYTEIPADSQIISISEQSDKVIINLNSAFVNGGGTESLYKRLYQLIKTAKLNSTLPVYLYIDGQKADVIGGDGIMITQPLSDRSLDN